jgi:RimJ/RimL family protein N-acetyltransferase
MDINIRKFKAEDTPELYAAVRESVAHLSPWLCWCTPAYSMADADFWVTTAEQEWNAGKDFRFVIECNLTGKFLGSVAINQVIQQHKIGNLGYWIRQSALNQGVCTNAASKAIEYGFNQLQLRRIEICTLETNAASIAVAKKLGATYEGILRNKLFHYGESYPAKCYSLIPNDLNKTSNT